jgi:HSP20 family molecular chaperone IbpA
MIISALESGCIAADLHRDVAEVSVEQLCPGMVAMTPHESDHDKVANATDATARSMQMQWFPVNAHEAPKAFVVVAALPAVVPEDVMIELGPSILRISARLRSSGPRGYVLHEWEYGGYEREIDVPQGFGGSLEASLTNGQLVVRVMRGAFTRQVSAQPHPA